MKVLLHLGKLQCFANEILLKIGIIHNEQGWIQNLQIIRVKNNICINRVFHSLYKVGRNGIIVFKGFNNSKKSYPPWGST